jgi:ABC-type transport system involved in cytochrome bd biosynthesis fused ATPase/permease subunit
MLFECLWFHFFADSHPQHRLGPGSHLCCQRFAGKLRLEHGTVRLEGSRAYCPQHAWAQIATVRDNILFGKLYDAAYYDRVVEACDLLPHFRMLPIGDLTEVGERGISLSGGH